MSVLTQLDLNATIEDYCVTILERSRYGKGAPAKGLKYSDNQSHLSGRSVVIIPQTVLDTFQEKMNIITSQKQRFSPHLFTILEKTHFENLLPYSGVGHMSRQEATDVFISYAEELHHFEEANKEIVEKIKGFEEDNHKHINNSYNYFTECFAELKSYCAETRKLIENHKKSFHKELDDAVEDALDGTEEYMRGCDKRFLYIDRVISDFMKRTIELECRCDDLEKTIFEINQDIKDIQVGVIKRMNHLETKLANQMTHSNITCYIVVIIFFVIQYILSVNVIVKTSNNMNYQMLPGV
jgi:uncharacterized coiled-coil protein SlyX